LPPEDCVDEGCADRGGAVETDASLAGSESDVCVTAHCRRGDNEVLGGAAEAGPKMVFLRIDHGSAPREIGVD
jgi:hypothetical protein